MTGTLYLSGSLKYWGSGCKVRTLCSSERSWELGVPSLLYGAVPRLGFKAKVCHGHSYSFQSGYFLSHLICRSHSISFQISFGENCFMCSCIFITSMGEGKFRNLLCHYHGPISISQSATIYLKRHINKETNKQTDRHNHKNVRKIYLQSLQIIPL